MKKCMMMTIHGYGVLRCKARVELEELGFCAFLATKVVSSRNNPGCSTDLVNNVWISCYGPELLPVARDVIMRLEDAIEILFV
jgi:hypothetical protein